MLSLIGTYKDGYVSFEQTLSVVKPVKVIITFLEDIETSDEIFLQLSDFSFQEARQVLFFVFIITNLGQTKWKKFFTNKK